MKKKFSDEKIDEILKSNPPVYSSGIYFSAMAKKFGISEQSVKDKCLMLGEEIGELFKAIRKQEGIKVDANSHFTSIEEEIADILELSKFSETV